MEIVITKSYLKVEPYSKYTDEVIERMTNMHLRDCFVLAASYETRRNFPSHNAKVFTKKVIQEYKRRHKLKGDDWF